MEGGAAGGAQLRNFYLVVKPECSYVEPGAQKVWIRELH